MPTQVVFSHLQPVTCSCVFKPFRTSDGHDLLSVVLHVLSSWSFEPFPILGYFRILCGYVGKPAVRHYGPRCSRVDHHGGFLPCPLCSSFVSLDQMVESSRRLHCFVFCKVVECWPLIRSLSPPGDSVLFGPTPVSVILKCLQTRKLFWRLPLKSTFP